MAGEGVASSVVRACGWGTACAAASDPLASASCCCVSLGEVSMVGCRQQGERMGGVLFVGGNCVVERPEVGLDHAVELVLPDLLVCGVIF